MAKNGVVRRCVIAMNASLEASWGAQCVGESKTPTSSRRRTESHTEPKNPERRLTHPEQAPEWLSSDLNRFFYTVGLRLEN